MSRISPNKFADRLEAIMSAVARGFLKQQASVFFNVKVTMPQFIILDFLKKEGESKMTDIAHSLSVTTAAMTGIVDRLVREGYVVRVSDPKDRRIIRVRLTSQGEGVVKKVHCQRRKMIVNAFSKISSAEREKYLQILMHMTEHLK